MLRGTIGAQRANGRIGWTDLRTRGQTRGDKRTNLSTWWVALRRIMMCNKCLRSYLYPTDAKPADRVFERGRFAPKNQLAFFEELGC